MRLLPWGGIATLLLLFSNSAFAFYCSTATGNGYINIGDSMAQVKQNCGMPNQEQVNEVPASSAITTTQYWLYENIQVLEESPLAVEGPYRSVSRQGPSFVIQVKNNVVTAITQGNESVESTNQCDQGVVRVGDSIDRLISACGKPSFVNVESGQGGQETPKKKVTTWTYQSNSYAAPLTLEFEDGKLTKIN